MNALSAIAAPRAATGAATPSRTPLLCALLLLALLAGCQRPFYRRSADREVAYLLRQKSNDPRWALPANYTVYYDPRSRYFDPHNPDHTPLPPDDPASHVFMHRVDGMHGFLLWHKDGDQARLDNPGWADLLGRYVATTPEGAIKLDLDTAVELAYIHSPDWQLQLETIYLSALDVSTERFRFVTQVFSGTGPAYAHLGRDRAGRNPGSDQLTVATDTQIKRRFAYGGNLLVGFANSFVFQFAGPNSNVTNSLINFSLVQPLLQNAGRAVVLEQLTIVERTLLGNLRALERYRQGFYTNLAVGDLNVTGPQRRGGFFGGTGLTGFSGQGSGGFGELGSATNFGRAGFAIGGTGGGGGGSASGFAGGGAGNIGGFLGLLQLQQNIRNSQNTLDSYTRLRPVRAAQVTAGTINISELEQFDQIIESERQTLIQSQIAWENTLDTFKRQTLGLPPHLPIVLDDTMIRQFQLIDPSTTALHNAIADYVDDLGNTPEMPPRERLETGFAEFEKLRKQVAEQFAQVHGDVDKLESAIPDRDRLIDSDSEKRSLAQQPKLLADTLRELEERLQRTEDDLEHLRDDLKSDTLSASTDALVALGGELGGIVQELALVQVRARLETVTIVPIELNSARALEIARRHRLDWMNNRAALVDTWRLITFNANALRSNLTVTFSGDLGTSGNNPLRFQAPNSALRAILRYDAPLTRLVERNNYRQVLIDYQQDRRTLIRFEDTVNQTLRQDLRALRYLRANLEGQRKAVTIAVRRVDQAVEDLNKPPEPNATTVAISTFALATTISDLRNAQNNFMSAWLNYESERMQLVRDLGVMQLDDRGRWIDRPLEELIADVPEDPYPLPPSPTAEMLREAGVMPEEIPPADPLPPLETVPPSQQPPSLLPPPGR